MYLMSHPSDALALERQKLQQQRGGLLDWGLLWRGHGKVQPHCGREPCAVKKNRNTHAHTHTHTRTRTVLHFGVQAVHALVCGLLRDLGLALPRLFQLLPITVIASIVSLFGLARCCVALAA